MFVNRGSLFAVGVLLVGICTSSACGPLNGGSPGSSSGGVSDGGGADSASASSSSGAASDSGATTDSASGPTDSAMETDTGNAAETGTGSVDTGVAEVSTGFPDTGTGGTSDAGPFPGCSTWGAFTQVLLFDQWVWSGWEPNATIGLTPDTCNLGDPLRPWEKVTPPAGAVGKCLVQHVDLQTQTNGWGAVAWFHWNPGDEGYPDQGQRVANPDLLSICSAKSVSFQVLTDTDGLVISFAAGDPGYEATSGPVTLTANVWKPITMTFSGWVQVPVARGFYWAVNYNQPALQGKTAFNFYFDDGKVLP